MESVWGQKFLSDDYICLHKHNMTSGTQYETDNYLRTGNMSYSTKVQQKHDLVQNQAKLGVNTAESVNGLPGGFRAHQ